MLARHYRALARTSYGQADRVMARSLAYANEATILNEVPADRLRVVPNGFDDHIFTPPPQRPKPDQILVVGRLVPYKGIRVLLDALSLIKDAPPLMVAGDGPLRQTLQDKASDLRVDARFLGHVSDQQLADLYRTSCFTVLPSVSRQEAFGMSLIESMGCGTPVIASDLPGVSQVARQGGLVARPDDAADLADKIRMLLEDPDRVPRGAPLANAIHATYAQAAIARQVAAVHAELVGRSTALSSAEEGDAACVS
jgi:glycosyltransferase involved in cell wall biosynthesis